MVKDEDNTNAKFMDFQKNSSIIQSVGGVPKDEVDQANTALGQGFDIIQAVNP